MKLAIQSCGDEAWKLVGVCKICIAKGYSEKNGLLNIELPDLVTKMLHCGACGELDTDFEPNTYISGWHKDKNGIWYGHRMQKPAR